MRALVVFNSLPEGMDPVLWDSVHEPLLRIGEKMMNGVFSWVGALVLFPGEIPDSLFNIPWNCIHTTDTELPENVDIFHLSEHVNKIIYTEPVDLVIFSSMASTFYNPLLAGALAMYLSCPFVDYAVSLQVVDQKFHIRRPTMNSFLTQVFKPPVIIATNWLEEISGVSSEKHDIPLEKHCFEEQNLDRDIIISKARLSPQFEQLVFEPPFNTDNPDEAMQWLQRELVHVVL
ncbi:hypothetical protein KKF34_11465 [Myxococcota bacterium]|nr:hypothetical protein [Myxococcota bacterium]MBU1381711.1 hypothetical protein [Myxococcota bacterium]MBU1497481.1 hypothetical protein [Myxococcota bacterium]